MRTGADYRAALRDGRKVFVLGEGRVEDVTTHAATAAVVEEYVAWYDRYHDPAWRERLFRADGTPWAYVLPKNAAELQAIGRMICATTFSSAGNLTHTPHYGNLIALGVQAAAETRNVSTKQIADAAEQRSAIARSGRFLTFCAGAAPIGHRLNPDPRERVALKLVRETDAGIVVSGKIGMHTSPAYAEDVYVGALSGIDLGPHRATITVAVNAPGVTVICRKPSIRHANPFIAPLTRRYDELDGQMWLDNVFIPWERVFLLDPSPDPVAQWLFWHQLYCWLMKAEYTLGLALACAQAMGLKEHEPTVEYLLDLAVAVQTVRSCQTAAEHDPSFTPSGYCAPNVNHVAAGSIAMLKARQRMSEILRILPGSSLIVAPADTDLATPELAQGLEESFAGGGYTALQRSALLQLAWDHVGSTLDHRESTFELHANGGIPAWRGRLRRSFGRFDELADAVLRELSLPMPKADLGSIAAAPLAPRRQVSVPVAPAPART